MNPNRPQRALGRTVLHKLCAALAACAIAPLALAQLTDISTNPLSTAAPNQVKPNLLFILDDSGSMARDYMPDDVGRFGSNAYGFYASQCNGLAYNPATTYRLPVDSTGADLAAGTFSFPAASDLANMRAVLTLSPSTIGTGSVTVTIASGQGTSNSSYSSGMVVTLFSNDENGIRNPRRMVGTVATGGWNSSTRVLTVNVTETQGSGTLTNPRVADGDNRPFYYTYTPTTGSPAALAYTYNSSGVITTSTFWQECNSNVGSSPGSARFTKVAVTPTAADIQNYRNWYTYYRTRIQMAQSATSLAFRSIGDRFRVGFTTISSTRVSGTNFLDVADFDPAQKSTFYSTLNAASPSSWTPLRGALAKAGKYYAKRGTRADGTAQTYDPVQFSCQKNFAILTTDGYWNTNTEVTGNGSGSYGPDDLSNNDVGQQDGVAARPMYDGAAVIGTMTTPMQQLEHWYRTRTRTQGATEQYFEYRTSTSGCSGSNRRVQTRTQTRTRTATQTETSYYGRTKTYNSVVTITNGVPSTPVEQNVSYSGYTPEGVTDLGTWVNGSWSAWTAGSWSNTGTCQASPVVPTPNPSATTSSTGSMSAWSGYSGYLAATPATDAAVATGAAVAGATTTSGGSTNSLADVAMYYYNTDLRTSALGNCTLASGTDVCTNNVPPRGSDTAVHQHMSTFTVGMGVSGTLGYTPNYLSGGSADFQQIVNGTRDWPIPGNDLGPQNIDDLWHAAVNGRGQYFSAGNPTVLATSLNTALAQIEALSGSGSGAAASTLQPVLGDNSLFIAKYTTVNWTGDVISLQIDPQSGAIGTTPAWSAEQVLDARVAAGTARNIFYMKRAAGANTGTKRDFSYNDLNADGLVASKFAGVCSKAVPLAQCTDSGYDVAGANLGANMVAYLRGGADSRYRTRTHVLGDIVGGAPVFVRVPPFQYTENNYVAFRDANILRPGVVYVAANDGMLHAFDGATGQEKWAYVPSMAMDNMYKLADNDYGNRHQFLVNGAPVIGDIWVPGSPGAWKTILVGGLGVGGAGYYALDITNPDSPQVLWEFDNSSTGANGNLGLAVGNPVITKRNDGTWIVAFTSGYNNVTPPGDGNGRLFIVNANTGERLMSIATQTAPGVPAGTTASPSGLGKLNAWVESTIDNKALRFYAGDLKGNLWRFDIDNLVQPYQAALRLAYLTAGSPSTPQPITTQPQLGIVDYAGSPYPVVYVGTGRLLGLSDLSSTGVQSVYAIKDPMNNTPLGDVHASSNMVAQTLSQAGPNLPRTVTNNAVNWSAKDGWYVDLIGSGERVNVDMQVIFQTLSVATNTPNNDACTAGGSSYLYEFNISTGSAPIGATNGEVGTWLGGTLVVGMSYLTLQQSGSSEAGTGRTITVIVDNRGVPRTDDVPPPSPPPSTGRRSSWRELVN